jgi:hypothetical protein
MGWGRFLRTATYYVPLKRATITLDSISTSSDYTITIPTNWSDFWDDVDSSGLEIAVTDADGTTSLAYQWSSFTKSSRTGVLQIDNYTAETNGVAQIHLYWGMSGATTGAGSFSASSPRSGYVDLGSVVRPIVTAPERPGDTHPRHQVSKVSTESIWVWFDFGHELVPMDNPSDTHAQWEEIDGVTYAVNLAGSAQSGMVSAASSRIYDGRYVRVLVQSGTTNTNYTISVAVSTTYPNQQSGRNLVRRALLKVYDVSEV